MSRRFPALFSTCFSLLFLLSACGTRYRAPTVVPASVQGHASLVVRFTAEAEGDRQRGRVVLDVDGERSRLLFLTPLNRVVMEMRVTGEKALLINRRRKSYWQGTFRHLLWRLWRMRMDFNSLRELLLTSSPPPRALERDGFKTRVERDADTGRPLKLEITGPSSLLTLKVLRRRRAAGPLLEPAGTMAGLRRADLEGVISRDE